MATNSEKVFYDFIQKRVNDKYKYLGTKVYNLTPDDVGKIKSLGDKWGIPMEWLCNLMNHESAGTFNPAIQNSIGATGLIQFLKSTAKNLGTTTDNLKSLTFQKQLEYVDKYLDGWKGQWKNRGLITNGKINDNFQQPDLFMTIFYPAAIGKPNFNFPESVQKANGGIKTPMDYARKALNNPPFPLSKVPSTLPEYRSKMGNFQGSVTITAGTPPIDESKPIEENIPISDDVILVNSSEAEFVPVAPTTFLSLDGEFLFNVEQNDFFAGNENVGDLYIIGKGEIYDKIQNSEELDAEYTEGVFLGQEESSPDLPDVDTITYDGKPDEGSNEVNTPTLVNYGTTGPVAKVPTGRSAYSHNSTQGYNLTDSMWYGDILTSALAHIEHPTFDVPGTKSGSLGCASWVSMVFYRAFGVHMRDGKPVKKIPKSIGDFGSTGTGELGGWFAQNSDMWVKIPWKEGKPGDIINTERGSSAGHVGVVLNEIHSNGTYTVASNSSGGFGNSSDPLGCGKKNYSIKTWESVTKRNPTRTFCWRYKGPKLKQGETA